MIHELTYALCNQLVRPPSPMHTDNARLILTTQRHGQSKWNEATTSLLKVRRPRIVHERSGDGSEGAVSNLVVRSDAQRERKASYSSCTYADVRAVFFASPIAASADGRLGPRADKDRVCADQSHPHTSNPPRIATANVWLRLQFPPRKTKLDIASSPSTPLSLSLSLSLPHSLSLARSSSDHHSPNPCHVCWRLRADGCVRLRSVGGA